MVEPKEYDGVYFSPTYGEFVRIETSNSNVRIIDLFEDVLLEEIILDVFLNEIKPSLQEVSENVVKNPEFELNEILTNMTMDNTVDLGEEYSTVDVLYLRHVVNFESVFDPPEEIY